MLRLDKRLLKTAKWTVIGGLAGDAVLLIGGYYYYQKLRNSSDFRHKIYQQDERLIDLYYRVNEKYGDGKAREQDCKQWGVTKIESFDYLHYFGF